MTCVVPTCDRADVRPYLRGNLCPDHAPYHPTPPPHGLTARSSATPAPTTPTTHGTAWVDRTDSTWIDKL